MDKNDCIEKTTAVSGKVIRLTFKQWYHITESHDYMAGNIDKVMETINSPDWIVRGSEGELIASKHYSQTNLTKKHCIVVYRENKDGFVITAFLTSKPDTVKKRGILWAK